MPHRELLIVIDSFASSKAYRRLLARVERRYLVGRVRFVAGEREYEVLKVADPDSVFDAAMAEENSRGQKPLDWQPYWAEAWESSLVLAQYVAELSTPTTSLLDLGCGVGVVGAVAAACGWDVMLGDIAQPGLLFSQLNVWPWRERALVRRIDWQQDWLGRDFDVIACADCVYDRRDFHDLDKFWRKHLSDHGEVLIAEPSRLIGREFRETIVQLGWTLDPSPGVRRSGKREVVVSRLTRRR